MTTVKLRDVCKELGLTLSELRQLLNRDPTFPPVEWIGPRSGFVFREDYEAWKADRHARGQRRREQEQRKQGYIAGRQEASRPLPEFLRK